MTNKGTKPDTKSRILNAAERLIAKQGFDVPLRAITTEAGVNLAAVNYHFQSKEALLDAVVARRLDPINDVRFRMLDEVEARFRGRPLPVEPPLRTSATRPAASPPVLVTGSDNRCHFR